MINEKSLKSLEFDKVAQKVAEYCVLYKTKEMALSLCPEENFLEAKHLQDRTSEAFNLLYNGGVSGIEFYDEIECDDLIEGNSNRERILIFSLPEYVL